MNLDTLTIHDLHFGESSLPDVAPLAEFVRQMVRKSAFDQLHRLFDGHIVADLHQKMDVVGHDHEIVQLEAMLGDKRTQDFDEKVGIALRLQQTAAHARFCRGEKDARRVEDVGRSGITGWMRHSRG